MEVDDVESSLIPSIVFANDEHLEEVEDVFPDDSLFPVYDEDCIQESPGSNNEIFVQVEEESQEQEELSSVEEIEEVPEDEVRLRFVLNLYGPERGYSYGLADPQLGETPESHLLPYTERYIIDCVDNGVIPWKIVTLLRETSGWDLISCEGTILAEIRDYRHFSTVSPITAKVRHVLLRSTNESLLSDMDFILKEGYKEKSEYDLERETENEAEDRNAVLNAKDESDTNDEESGEPSPSLPSSNDSECSPLPSTSASSSSGVEDEEEETFSVDIKEDATVDDEEGSSMDEESSSVDDQDESVSVGDVSEDDDNEQEIEDDPPLQSQETVLIKEEPEDLSMNSMNHVVSPIKVEHISSPHTQFQQQFTPVSVKQEAPSTAHMEYNSTIFNNGEVSSIRSNSYNKSDVDCDYSSKHFLPVNCRIVKQGVIDSSSINDKDVITNLPSQNLSEPYGNGMCKIYVCSPCNSNEKETDLNRYSSGSENQSFNGKPVITPEENSNNYIGCYTMKIEENGESSFTEILNHMENMEMNENMKSKSEESIVSNCVDFHANATGDTNCSTIEENGRDVTDTSEIGNLSHTEIKTEYEPMEMNGESSLDYTDADTYCDMEVSLPLSTMEEAACDEDVGETSDFMATTHGSDSADDPKVGDECAMEESDNFSQNEVKTEETDDDSSSEDEYDNDSGDESDEDCSEILNYGFYRTKCDHKYDRQHYDGARSGSSSENETSSESDSGESSSENSTDSEASSFSEASVKCSDSELVENDLRTERQITNANEIETEENVNSDTGSNGESSGSDGESNESEYFNEKKHRLMPEPTVFEDKQFIIVDEDPFAPENTVPQTEYFGEKSQKEKPEFISTEEFEDSEFVGYEVSGDDIPNAEIVSDELMCDEKHPNGLVREHQIALFGRELDDDEMHDFDDDDSDNSELEEDLKNDIEEDEKEEEEDENGESMMEKYGNDMEVERLCSVIEDDQLFQESLRFIDFAGSDEEVNNIPQNQSSEFPIADVDQSEESDESESDSESIGYCVAEIPEEVNEEEILILDEDPNLSPNSNTSELNKRGQYSPATDPEIENGSSDEEDEPIVVMMEGEDGQTVTDNLENFDEDEQQAILNSLQDYSVVNLDEIKDNKEHDTGEVESGSGSDISDSDEEEQQYYDEGEKEKDIENEEEQLALTSGERGEIFPGADEYQPENENLPDDSNVENDSSEIDARTDEELLAEMLQEEISDSEIGLSQEETANLNDEEKGLVADAVRGILDGTHFDILAEDVQRAIDELNSDPNNEVENIEKELVVWKEVADEVDSAKGNSLTEYQDCENMKEELEPCDENATENCQNLEDMEEEQAEENVGEVEDEYQDIEDEDMEEEFENGAENTFEEEYQSCDDEDPDDEDVDKEDLLDQLFPGCDNSENSNEASSNNESDNEDMDPDEIDKILNSEECDDVLHGITSEIMLRAATDDYLVKGLKLSFVQEMNQFVHNAYAQYAEDPLANKYVDMTKEELQREIDLEIAADKFILGDDYNKPTDLDSLDARLFNYSGDFEDLKELDQEFFTEAELKEFMQFKLSLDDFCTEDDPYLEQLHDLDKISENENVDEARFDYSFMDENYFTKEALNIYLAQKIEEGLDAEMEQNEEEDSLSEEVESEHEMEDLEESYEMEMEDNETKTELSYDQRLNLEEIFVNKTSHKLCLDPSPLVGVLSNRLQFEKLKWNAPEIKNAMRNWVAPEPLTENHFSKLYKENPNNEHVRAHLKRKRSSLLRKPRPIESIPNRNARGFKRPRALLEPRELTLSKLLRSDMDEDIVPPPPAPEEDSFYDSPESFHSFFQFVLDSKAKKAAAAKPSDKDEPQLSFEEKCTDPVVKKKMLTLEPPQIIDFMDVEAPSNYDVLKKVFKTPEPSMIQSFPIENTCRVIEEYLLETDRKKKPHYTKVTIYQRNYLENYHGEVLMESLFEATAPSPLGKFPKIPPYTTCEFCLGCSSDVALYIKQFLDIFSEDGKRACKVTCHKVGQPFPFVVATPYYKPIFPEPPIPKEFQFTIGPTTVNPYPTYMERNMKFPTQGFTQNLTHLYYPGGPGHTGQHNQYVNQLLSLNQNNNYSQSSSNSYGFLGHSLYNTSSNASSANSSSTSSSTSTSQPPVQIVHPQPRPVQQIIASSAAAASISSGQIYAASSGNPVLTQSIQQQPSTNVNFNVNVNSSIVGISPQQVLTRPHIVNVNVQQQQPQQQTIQTRAVNVPTQQQLQLLAQQRSLRMRQLQKQQQYIQQHPTALAKLLTSNIQGHVGSGTNKPITVAVPPQPQNLNKNANNPPQSPSESLTMSIGSPIEHHAIQHHPPTVSPSPNVNVNVNTSPNVNVNLNTISLDGLLSGTPSGINYSTASNIVTSNVSVVGNNRIVSGTSISPATALNILRLNAGGGTGGNVSLINTNNIQRGLTVSNINSNNVSIMSQPQQRILVNSAGNVVATHNQQQLGDLEEISVTDLNSFLNSQQIQICQLGVGQQVALSQNHPQLQQQLQLQQTTIPQQHIQTMDSHNVNLNLNVNLNSGTSESSQQIAKIQGGDWTTTSNSNAPFVVFISPLTRPLNSENSGQTSRAGPSSTVNVNLAAIQTTPPHSSQQPQTIVLETTANGNKTQNHQQFDGQNLISSEIVGVTPEGVAVDTLFNALSDAIGPELGKKLDVIGSVVGHNTVVVSSTVNVPISSPAIQSRISPQSHLPTYNLINMQSGSPSSSTHAAKFTSHVAPSQQNTNVITLNDLLASPTIVSSSTGGNYSGSGSFVLSSNNSGNANATNNANAGALLSPISNSKPSASPGPSNTVSSTPRLSALLAGTPSADTMISGNNSQSILGDSGTHSSSNSLLANAIDSSHTTANYGNLLDRLAASLSNPPGAASQLRTGISRLNPIASATPNVVLEHPMLAASLTQQSPPQPPTNRATAYRQIAPAPPPNLVQHAHAPPQQLINLLGLNQTGQARTIRISASTPVTGKPSPGSGNMGAGR